MEVSEPATKRIPEPELARMAAVAPNGRGRPKMRSGCGSLTPPYKHPNPEDALSDGFQALKPDEYAQLVERLGKLLGALDRQLVSPHV